MKNKIKYYFLVIIIAMVITPNLLMAQSEKQDIVFQAQVSEVLKDKTIVTPEGRNVRQQNLRLHGLTSKYRDQDMIFTGIGSVDVIKQNIYKKGDKVLVVASADDQEQVTFYVIDYVRSSILIWLFAIFLLVLLAVGKSKGLRAAFSLFLSFVIIIKYIIPQILSGADPIIVSIIGSFIILLIIVYLTEGFNKKSHIASLSIFLSLLTTILLSALFVQFARLSGLGSENVSFLVGLNTVEINFKGLLLAGIIIGTLGVLDDVIISQIVAVEQLYKADKYQSRREVYQKAYKIGTSHISSMANTLFLAYAGASFPLLILFVSGESAFSGLSDVLNNEAIATEIVRTLAGSVGLVLAVPLSTFLAVWFLKEKNNEKNKEF